MQNRLVRHLVGTKLCCALPKCTLVQNYVINLDLHVILYVLYVHALVHHLCMFVIILPVEYAKFAGLTRHVQRILELSDEGLKNAQQKV